MAVHVVVGAGSVGTATARELAAVGHSVKLVSRSGSGPDVAGVELVVADAFDPRRLEQVAGGAAALYNCVSPPSYDRWAALWPPLAASFLQVAESTGAVLVTMGNLYGYGPVAGEMTESLPLAATGPKGRIRARMWQDALAAHAAGRIRGDRGAGIGLLRRRLAELALRSQPCSAARRPPPPGPRRRRRAAQLDLRRRRRPPDGGARDGRARARARLARADGAAVLGTRSWRRGPLCPGRAAGPLPARDPRCPRALRRLVLPRRAS